MSAPLHTGMHAVRPTAVAIFVKTPGFSPVKTRLAADIGRDAAERLHVAAAHAVAAVLPGCTPRPPGHFAVAEPRALSAWSTLPCVAQGPGGLGARLHLVFAALQSQHGSALLLGADAPQVDAALLDQALAWLAGRGPRLVFGPAADGGFWTFGANVPVPQAAWTGVAYSRADTGSALLHAVEGLGVLHRLPELRDLDSAGDLLPVLQALSALPRPIPEQRTVTGLLQEALAQLQHAGAARDCHG